MAQWDCQCLGSAGMQVRSLARAQWVKDLALLQLQLRSQLQFGSDPWPRSSIGHGAAKNGKKKKGKEILVFNLPLFNKYLLAICLGSLVQALCCSSGMQRMARKIRPLSSVGLQADIFVSHEY